MESTARIIIFLGILLVIIGGSVLLFLRIGFPLGILPGDIHLEGKGMSFFFPLSTCIILSVGLTILVNILIRIFNR